MNEEGIMFCFYLNNRVNGEWKQGRLLLSESVSYSDKLPKEGTISEFLETCTMIAHCKCLVNELREKEDSIVSDIHIESFIQLIQLLSIDQGPISY